MYVTVNSNQRLAGWWQRLAVIGAGVMLLLLLVIDDVLAWCSPLCSDCGVVLHLVTTQSPCHIITASPDRPAAAIFQAYWCMSVWNKLPLSIRSLNTFNSFNSFFLNTSVCSLLMSTVLLPPSDRTRLGFKPCAWLLCALSSVCMYVCVCVCCIAFHLSSTSSVTGGKVHLQNDQLFCVSFFLSSWWRGTRRCLAGELSLSCARHAADGWPLMWVNRPLQVSQLGQLSLSSFLGR